MPGLVKRPLMDETPGHGHPDGCNLGSTRASRKKVYFRETYAKCNARSILPTPAGSLRVNVSALSRSNVNFSTHQRRGLLYRGFRGNMWWCASARTRERNRGRGRLRLRRTRLRPWPHCEVSLRKKGVAPLHRQLFVSDRAIGKGGNELSQHL